MTRGRLQLGLVALFVALLLRGETAAAFAPDATARVAAHMSRGPALRGALDHRLGRCAHGERRGGADLAELEAALRTPPLRCARAAHDARGTAVRSGPRSGDLRAGGCGARPRARVRARRSGRDRVRGAASGHELGRSRRSFPDQPPPNPERDTRPRAWLGQPMDTDVPVRLSPLAANWQIEPLAQAVGLAQRSAATRPKVEDAARRGDERHGRAPSRAPQ